MNCGDFSDYADLRRIDLSGARLKNANFQSSKLEGISFTDAQLQGAFLDGAKLQGASLDRAQLQGASLLFAGLEGASLGDTELQGASLNGAQLQDASLYGAKLQGASLRIAQLQGASLDRAKLQGASLADAQLQGASLNMAELQGAFLNSADLRGASLNHAELQGASLRGAKLQGASLYGAQLQGTRLEYARLNDAMFSRAWIWRTDAAYCIGARVTDPKNDVVIAHNGREPIPAIPDQIEKFITAWVAEIPGEHEKEDVRKNLRERLTADPANDNSAALGDFWRRCERESRKVPQEEFDRRHAAVLRRAVCDAESDGATIGRGIARNWISKEGEKLVRALRSEDWERRELNLKLALALRGIDGERPEFSAKLARALLGEDGTPCAPAKDYDEDTRRLLRGAAGPPRPRSHPNSPVPFQPPLR